MPDTLTPRQDAAFEYIKSYIGSHQRPPTYAEIKANIGLNSTNGLMKIIKALETKGYIERQKHAARSIKLCITEDNPFGQQHRLPQLPLLGAMSSAQGQLWRQFVRQNIAVDPYLLRGVYQAEEKCLIVVAGDDGLSKDHIRKGDLVLVEETPAHALRNDTLVAAVVGDRVQIRRFSLQNNLVHLHPNNRYYTMATYPKTSPECFVLGRAFALFRALTF
ncbi:MAG: transcriptional repressor LexA [Rhodothermales bacterium]